MKKIWKIFVGVIFLAVCSGCGIKKEQKKTIEDTKERIYRECEMLADTSLQSLLTVSASSD